jgi:hypothetical protein
VLSGEVGATPLTCSRAEWGAWGHNRRLVHFHGPKTHREAADRREQIDLVKRRVEERAKPAPPLRTNVVTASISAASALSLEEFAGLLRCRFAWFIREATVTEPEALSDVAEIHRQWLEALRSHDLVRASSAICRHYQSETDSIVRLIESSDHLRCD